MPVLVGGQPIVKASDGNGVVIASSTYHPGHKAQIFNVPVLVGSDNVVIGGTTHILPSETPQPSPSPVLIGGHSILKASGGDGVVIASSIYTPGSQAKVSGINLSVGSANVSVDGSTHALPSASTPTPVLIKGHSLLQAPDGNGMVVASKTYTAGTKAEISGVPVSVGSDRVVVSGSTHSLPPQSSPPTPLSIGGNHIAVAPSYGGIVIASKTYTPGAKTEIPGTSLSVGSGMIEVAGTTHSLPSHESPHKYQLVEMTYP